MSRQETVTVTVPEAARALAVSSSTVHLMLRKGELRGRKVGRDWSVEMDSVNEVFARKYPHFVRKEE